MTAADLAESVGIAKSAMSRYENRSRQFPVNKVAEFAKALGTSPEFLLGFKTEVATTLSQITDTSAKLDEKRQTTILNVAKKELNEQEHEKQDNVISLEQRRQQRLSRKLATICFAGAVSAGTGEFLGDETTKQIELPEDMIPVIADFCLIVNGKSMEPVFTDGSYVFIEKQPELPNGSIGVIIVNNEAFLKRVWFENNHARLESFNEDYKDIIVTEEDDFRIIGKVVM